MGSIPGSAVYCSESQFPRVSKTQLPVLLMLQGVLGGFSARFVHAVCSCGRQRSSPDIASLFSYSFRILLKGKVFSDPCTHPSLFNNC